MRKLQVGLLGLIVVLAAVILVVLVSRGTESSSESPSTASSSEPSPATPEVVSAPQLRAEASTLPHRAYWVGARAGTESYELTSTPNRRIYVRYLTGGAKAGDPRADFVTVGTYPVPEARRALRRAKAAGDGTALSKHRSYEMLLGKSNNVYVVFANEPDLQIEIFSPTPGEAKALATSGALKPLR